MAYQLSLLPVSHFLSLCSSTIKERSTKFNFLGKQKKTECWTDFEMAGSKENGYIAEKVCVGISLINSLRTICLGLMELTPKLACWSLSRKSRWITLLLQHSSSQVARCLPNRLGCRLWTFRWKCRSSNWISGERSGLIGTWCPGYWRMHWNNSSLQI